MKCPHCFQENNGENIYCVNCGKKIQDSNNVVCPKCGQFNIQSSIYCTFCGTKLLNQEQENAEKKCPACGKANPEENLYCVGCGTKLETKISKESLDIASFYKEQEIQKKAQLSLVFGIVATIISLIVFWIPFLSQGVAIVLGVVGIVSGVKGLKCESKVKSVVGIIFSIAAILISLFYLIIYLIAMIALVSLTEEELKAYLENFYSQHESLATIIKIRMKK